MEPAEKNFNELLKILTHDLLQPVMSIEGAVKAMDKEATGRQKLAFELIAASTRNILEFIESLRTFQMYQHAATNSKSTFLLIDEPLDEELKERRLNAEEKQLEFIVHSKATELIFFDAFILKKLIIAPLIDFCIKQALEKSSIEIVAEEENEKALLQLQFLTSKAFPDRQSLLFQAGPTDLKSFKSIPLPFRNLFLVKDLVKNLNEQLIFTTEPHDLSNSIQKIQFRLEIKVKRP